MPRFRRALDRIGASRETRLIVAYSGGPDSTALLALLSALPPHARPELLAIHVDHGLRPGSGAEARAAVACAGALGVPCRIVRVRPAGPGGPEARARAARYAALARLARGRPILTAHSADDQAETLLLRLARGSGLAGAAGIRRTTVLSGARVLRPLLSFTRAELAAAIAGLPVTPVQDPSNADLRLARNRVRAEVLPALSRAYPGASAALARAAELAAEDERYLASRAQRARVRLALGAGVDAAALSRLPRALQGRIVRALVVTAGGPVPDRAQVLRVLELARRGGELHLAGGVRAEVRGGVLAVAPGPTGQAAAGRGRGRVPGRTSRPARGKEASRPRVAGSHPGRHGSSPPRGPLGGRAQGPRRR